MEHPYLGIDYQRGTYKFDTAGDKGNPDSVLLRAGTEINRYLGAEAQLGTGVTDDKVDVGGGFSFTTKVRGVYGLYARPQIEMGGVASLYALVGYSYVQLAAGGSDSSLSSAHQYDSSTSYGGGLDFNVYHGIRLNVDYMRYTKYYSAVGAGIRFPIN
jgi:hypothetical protein